MNHEIFIDEQTKNNVVPCIITMENEIKMKHCVNQHKSRDRRDNYIL